MLCFSPFTFMFVTVFRIGNLASQAYWQRREQLNRLLGWKFQGFEVQRVESRCDAVALGFAYLLPPLSFGGASLALP